MTDDDRTDRLRNYQALRLAFREATREWLAARSHYERMQTDAGAETQRLLEAARTYAFAAHRRSMLYCDVEHFAEALDGCAHLSAIPASAR